MRIGTGREQQTLADNRGMPDNNSTDGTDSGTLKKRNDRKLWTSYKTKKTSWNAWCIKMEIWNGQNLQYERIAWVRIRGIPPQLWEDEVFDSIERKYGEIMQGSLASTNDDNLASDMVAIMLIDGLTVKGEAKIVRNGITTRCWIT
ncbi:hypothetical protein L1987_22823 [Smallanthus sonchifolius]|uniref:Uncharacterized protein n=1 Tax=Smallanthus sonchifolius TaxID=185202 RepID=A0ACB9IHF0_9ASTR|nr:hypothetical protein L1987_22823 [Smallanthus sonchifolius]